MPAVSQSEASRKFGSVASNFAIFLGAGLPFFLLAWLLSLFLPDTWALVVAGSVVTFCLQFVVSLDGLQKYRQQISSQTMTTGMTVFPMSWLFRTSGVTHLNGSVKMLVGLVVGYLLAYFLVLLAMGCARTVVGPTIP